MHQLIRQIEIGVNTTGAVRDLTATAIMSELIAMGPGTAAQIRSRCKMKMSMIGTLDALGVLRDRGLVSCRVSGGPGPQVVYRAESRRGEAGRDASARNRTADAGRGRTGSTHPCRSESRAG